MSKNTSQDIINIANEKGLKEIEKVKIIDKKIEQQINDKEKITTKEALYEFSEAPLKTHNGVELILRINNIEIPLAMRVLTAQKVTGYFKVHEGELGFDYDNGAKNEFGIARKYPRKWAMEKIEELFIRESIKLYLKMIND